MLIIQILRKQLDSRSTVYWVSWMMTLKTLLALLLLQLNFACVGGLFSNFAGWISGNAQNGHPPIEAQQWGSFNFMLKDINVTLQHEVFKRFENTEKPKKLAKILYFVMVTEGEEQKALRLLKRIQAPYNYYMIHIDQKMNTGNFAIFIDNIKNMNKTVKNMYLTKSYQATYKGITLVDQELTAMAIALQKNMNWTHYINISPSTYPLLQQYEISKLLAQIPPELSFMEMSVADCQTIFDRFTHIYYDLGLWGYSSRGAIESKQRVPVPKNLKIFKAFQWKILSRELAEYFVISSDGWARRLFAFFSMTLIPDEHYIVTTACNSPIINNTIRFGQLHYMNWDDIDWGKRAGKIGPNTISLKLLENALNQGAFFARKFDDNYDGAQSIQLLDQLLDEGYTVLNGNVYTRDMQFNQSKNALLEYAVNGDQCQQLLDADLEQPCISKRLEMNN